MMVNAVMKVFCSATTLLVCLGAFADVDLGGSWAFRFEEGKCLEEVADGLGSRPCQMTDTIVVPG